MMSLTVEESRYFTMGDGITGTGYLCCVDDAFVPVAYVN